MVPDGPQNGLIRLSDELLNFYGDLFLQLSLRQSGISFEQFLCCPTYYLARAGWSPERPGPRNILMRMLLALFHRLPGRREAVKLPTNVGGFLDR